MLDGAGETFMHSQAASGLARMGGLVSAPPDWWRRYVHSEVAPTMPASASHHLIHADAHGSLQYASTRSELALLDVPAGGQHQTAIELETPQTAHKLVCQGVSARASGMIFDGLRRGTKLGKQKVWRVATACSICSRRAWT
eukprot:7381690-Prymnesium_polylepis.1